MKSAQVGAVLALFLSTTACSRSEAPREKPVPEAGFVTVSTQSVALPTILAGRTSPFEVSEVRPQVSGVIKARNFEEGSIVRAGQTLYQIDSSVYSAAAAEASANLASAEAVRSGAATRAARLKPLADMEAVSKQDYTDAAATARQAGAAVAQSRAQLDAARINLRFTRVPAPITGRIGRSLVTTGGLVTANQADPLTTIQRLDPMFVDIQQSSAELLKLRRSLMRDGVIPTTAAVRLTLEDGSAYAYAGTLQFTEAVVDENTGTVTLRARFPNPQGLLLPGMYVRASLSQATLTDAILLSQAAVTRDARGNGRVLVIDRDGKAASRAVTVERSIGDKWLITAGLKPGERVIVEGLSKIKPGQKVIAMPAGSKPRPPRKAATR